MGVRGMSQVTQSGVLNMREGIEQPQKLVGVFEVDAADVEGSHVSKIVHKASPQLLREPLPADELYIHIFDWGAFADGLDER